ncbi:MAG: hypothetical protein HZB39_08160 [Planctomycetes bacterium]|nr:hypothetical protein [Planctomycetota bacterium]
MIRKLELDESSRDARWPACSAWDLASFWRELRKAVFAFEDAIDDGALPDAFADDALTLAIGPVLRRTYRAIAARGSDSAAGPRRREVVHALLDQLHDEAFVVRKWGVARGSPWRRKAGIETAVDAQDLVVQRLDQVAARRFWGLGFVHEDNADASDELARQAVRAAVARFARDRLDLDDVLRRMPDPKLVLVPGHADRRFERLMLDILDENHHRAEPARLAEDFGQKTDLRVRYPGLDRARGARVQVKAARIPQVHELRVADIRNKDTLVILSPVTIARFIDAQVHRRMAPLLDKQQLDAFWRSIPGQPTTIDELAPAIGVILDDALRSPTRDPRGPLALVPAALRVVIRMFVRHEAFRSTQALRVYEASGTGYRRARRGDAGEGESTG